MRIKHRVTFWLLFVLTALFSSALRGAEAVSTRDSGGRTITLTQPAQRVIALAPNLTELLFAVGAGGQLVGVADHSDYPPEARQIPRIGGYDRFEPERVVALRPDLVIGWESGNPLHTLEALERFGLTVFRTDPRRLEHIPGELERLGLLTGHEAEARDAAHAFRVRHAALETRYRDASPVSMFYQVWHQPLMTINGAHLISDVIALCGGVNRFASLPDLAPVIELEAVLTANPEAIVASGMGEARPDWLDQWRVWSPLTAVTRDNLFFVPPDLLQRHTPRILDGAERVCEHLETARRHRPGAH
ncbi:MAG: cobalamin-binding protein [Magnetococcales bacterium]|nr:cobalamin-binding protein [Magnetococcales bacterium]